MATYLYRCAYTPEAWAKMAKNPQDRFEIVRPVIEAAGGKLISGWFSFGAYDVVAICEAPDDIAMASVAVAFASGGAIRSAETTRLLTAAEGVDVMAKAGALTYSPPA